MKTMEITESQEYKFVTNLLDLYRRFLDLNIKHEYAKFKGFDGNYENYYMACAQYIIEDENKFPEQKEHIIGGNNMNSHIPMLDKYKRMLSEHENVSMRWEFSLEEAHKILDA